MNNIKKLLIYPLSLIVFFGLTANTCDELGEKVALEVPFDMNEISFPVTASEAVFEQEVRQEVDLSKVDEIEKNKKQIEEATAQSITLGVTDNLAQGSAAATGHLDFTFADGKKHSTYILFKETDLKNLDGKTYTIDELDPSGDLKDSFSKAIKEGEKITYNYLYTTSGAVDYTVTATLSATLKVTP